MSQVLLWIDRTRTRLGVVLVTEKVKVEASFTSYHSLNVQVVSLEPKINGKYAKGYSTQSNLVGVHFFLTVTHRICTFTFYSE